MTNLPQPDHVTVRLRAVLEARWIATTIMGMQALSPGQRPHVRVVGFSSIA